MPYWPNSSAALLANPSTPCRRNVVHVVGEPSTPLPDEDEITEPPPRAFMAGVTALRVRQGAYDVDVEHVQELVLGMSANGCTVCDARVTTATSSPGRRPARSATIRSSGACFTDIALACDDSPLSAPDFLDRRSRDGSRRRDREPFRRAVEGEDVCAFLGERRMACARP